MSTLYSIKDWAQIYETHETKKLKVLRWVPMPNKHDGLTFRQTAREKQSPDLFAAWILMVQLASRAEMEHRGRLIRNNRPMTAADMALVTGFPEVIFKRALVYFTKAAVGWMVAEDFKEGLPPSPGAPGESPDESAKVPAKPVSSPEKIPLNGREGKGKKGMERKRRNGRRAPPDGEALEPPKLAEVVPFFASLNAPAELAKKFHSHYQANGWRQGGGLAIVDWRAQAEKWIADLPASDKNSNGSAAPDGFDPKQPNAHTGGVPLAN